MNRKKILWLVSWYPNRSDRFDGDFIQRHARAAAIHHDIHVLFVKGSDLLQEDEEESRTLSTGLTEQIVYFREPKGILGRLQKQLTWKRIFMREIASYIRTNGLPSLVHVHVPWKAGLIALLARRRWGLPYIITEHWGIYNHLVEGHFGAQPLWVRKGLKAIYAGASHFITVSRFLGERVNEMVRKLEFRVIPNVVDTTLFHAKGAPYRAFTFIHVSNMVALKNVGGIIEAFAGLERRHPGIQLVLVGNRDRTWVDRVAATGLLNRCIFFRGEITYREVAEELRRAHVFILNSIMENSPCVIGEALCCGVPVIATAVGGVPELLDPDSGILTDPTDPGGLERAMEVMIKEYHRYDPAFIAGKAAARFGYGPVAAQFDEIYSELG